MSETIYEIGFQKGEDDANYKWRQRIKKIIAGIEYDTTPSEIVVLLEEMSEDD